MKKRMASIIFGMALMLLNQASAFGDVAGCGCYCGKVLPPPCSDEACKQACGWQEPSTPSSEPSYDYEAERQRQEAERQIELEQQRQREIEEQKKKEETEARRRQEEFERSKQEALKSMKGISEGELGLKGGNDTGLGLKGLADTDTGNLSLKDLREANTDHVQSAAIEPPTQMIRQDIDKARRRIPELEKDIKRLQTLLRQFGASSRGSASEFEKWQDTFQVAADNSFETAKEYGLSLFLQYNLLGSLKGSVKKDTFSTLDKLINASDPQMRRWLAEQLQERHVELGLLEKVVKTGTLGGDFAGLLSGDPLEQGRNLDALLFVNDLLETAKVVPWAGSEYFQQAKAIGETYTDLAAYGLACLNVRKTQKVTDAYAREISYLSTKLKGNVKEMSCLKQCLENDTARCFDRCEGKTRFGSPPPPPRSTKGS